MEIKRSALYAGLLAVLLGAGTAAAQATGGGAAGSESAVDSPGTEGSTGSGPAGTDAYDNREDDATRDGPAEIDRADDMRDAPAEERRATESVDAQGERETRRRPWWKFWQRDRDVEPMETEQRDDLGEPVSPDPRR